jgi:hypothetical protein
MLDNRTTACCNAARERSPAQVGQPFNALPVRALALNWLFVVEEGQRLVAVDAAVVELQQVAAPCFSSLRRV